MADTVKNLRCVVCPIGCSISAVLDESGKVLSVTGNTCPRGKAYAESELTHPVRTLTSTVFTADGRKLPVRTSRPIGKEFLFPAMDEIRKIKAPLPVNRGDVLVRNFMEDGADLIACKDMK
ncbi:MAG: DUF1667 domain-containing protein [Clostridia bacterium]|nr:DUF1667 domain-containing protein [Clostridia bacterium]